MSPNSMLRARRARTSISQSNRRRVANRLHIQCLEDRALMVVPIAPPGFTAAVATFTQSTPTAIPTGPAVVTSTVVVSGVDTYLFDLDLTTNLTHTFAADLDITIMSPAGTIVTLTTDNGAGNDNVFNGTLWDDDANPAGQVPYTTNNGLVTDHAYVNLTTATPLVPEEAMGAFIGEDPNGIWTITISDDLAGDGGSLDSWSVAIATLPTAPTTQTDSFTNSTPLAVPTGPTVVSANLNVSGLPTYLLDLNLTTFLTYTFAADLDITLTSPAGTVVTLTSDNGAGNDNTYNGTVWDDDANPAGQVPYTTNNGLVTDHAYVNLTLASPLVPEEAMAAFIGEDPNGTWIITISDDLAGDGGSLDSWTLEITSVNSLDYGDAPDPTFPTLLASNGARHVATGPRLGANRDIETDGAQSAQADGDDTTGVPDDEDGVVFGLLRRGAAGSVTVDLQNAGFASLDAWIDFNGNGTWEPAEQIADTLAMIAGPNVVNFAVPANASLGNTFARFRLSTAGNLDTTGFAADGEVEDYAVTINANIPLAPPGFPATTTGYVQSTPTAISASGTPVVTSTIVVSGAGSYLFDLNMQTFLQHSFSSDLDITLTSPAGTVVTITTDNASTLDNVYNGTIWDDSANPLGALPYTTNNGLVTDHLYVNNVLASPLVPEEAFGAFIGENPNGTWTITISDDSNLDGGSLDSWSLEISTISGPPNTVAGTFSNVTPVPIPTGPAVVSSTIVIAGAPTYLLDVNMTTFIQHIFAADLDVTLMSPSGTIVTITTDNGAGNDNVFNGTLWDDDANPGGQVPYTTNNGVVTDHVYVNGVLASPLVPEEAMAAFIGEDPNGVWTLTISDDLAGDGGSLDAWILDFVFVIPPFVPNSATVIPDPVNPGDDVLLVNGTNGNDVILIDPFGTNQTRVRINGVVVGTFANSSYDRFWVNGLQGNDKIVINASFAKQARLFGNEGNDTLYGAKGNDILEGGDGNDSIYGLGGNDTASGGIGLDRIWGDAGNDSISGGAGVDSIYGGAGNDTANGDEANDTLFGDAGNDSLNGGDGNDSINAGAGLDFARGGAGNDRMDGGIENDILLGEANNDTIIGGHGRDLIIGGTGADSFTGAEHEDLLVGGSTSFDANNNALLTIMAEWSANRPYATRVANVRNGTGPILTGTGFFINPAVNVVDDAEIDTLNGGLSLDWFIAGVGDLTPGRTTPPELLN